jgi:PAS domain S-box-containing protein
VLGAIVFALGAAAVCGYLIGLPMYALGESKPMAANAGVGFLALGLGVMALAERRLQPSPSPEEGILWWTEWKVRAGFALALGVLIVIGGMSYSGLVRMHEERVRVDHTNQVISYLRLISPTVADAEASVRGYIITGNEEFLGPYQRAVRDVGAELGTLRSLTADNSVQQGQLDVLEPLLAERLLLIQETVELRRGKGFPAAQQHVASAGGEQLHERIRGVMGEMEATEQSLLRERAARAHHASTVAKTTIVGGITLAFAFVAVALFMIGQDFVGSRRAQAALEEARGQLEDRVRARTAELKEAAAAARGSEARLDGIINSAMDAIVTVDEQQRIVLFNPAAEKMFGRRAAEAIGQPLDQFIPERFRAAHRQHHRDFGQTGLTRRHMRDLGSISGLRSSGEEFPIEASISKVDLEERKLFTAILRDITERQRAEDALQESEERLRLFIEHAPAALAMFDREMRYLQVSRRWLADYGLGDRDVRGVSHYEIFPEVPARWKEAHRRGLAGEVLREESDRFERADGTLQWICWEIRPWYETSGEIGGIVIFAEDITERKQAEAALRESEERLQKVTEGMTEGLVISDMNGELVHWNPAAIEMHGFTDPEVWRRQLPEMKDIFELSTLDGTLVPFEQWPFPRIYRGERLREYELRVRRIDRDWERVFSYGGTLVQDSQGTQIAFCTIADITERKRAEEESRLLNRDLERRVAQRTAELQAANQELESFSYSVAHDLRAPLRAVDGFSDAVLEDYGPQLPEQAREYLETIRRGAQRMGALIDDLLAFSRLTRQSITKQPVDMESLVRGVLADVVPEAATGKIQIVDGNLPAAHGDPALLRQVWANLLSNAVKYSRHAQQARIEVGSLTEGKKDIYYVRDNGAGFDMKYADKLFGVFQRLHRGDEFEGTGIGLAIVQRVIHRHGGRVWAEAKVNEGATFYFTLGGDN